MMERACIVVFISEGSISRQDLLPKITIVIIESSLYKKSNQIIIIKIERTSCFSSCRG